MSIKVEVGTAAIDAARRHTPGVGDAPVEVLRPADRRRVHESEMKEARRGRGVPGHECRPPAPQVHDSTGWA